MTTVLHRLMSALLAAFVFASCSDATAPVASSPDSEAASLDRGHGDDDDDDDDDKGRDATVCRNQTLTGTFQRIYIPRGNSCWIRAAFVYHDIRGDDPRHVEITSVVAMEGIRIQGGGETHQYIWMDNVQVHKGGIDVRHRSGGGIALFRSWVYGGDVQLDKNNVTNFLHVDETQVRRSVHVINNRVASPAYMIIRGNVVTENLLVNQTDGNGPKSVVFNAIGNNLICLNNDHVFVGQPNQAWRAHGQCDPTPQGGGKR